MPLNVCETVLAAVIPGTTKSGERAVPLQATWMVTAPCWPAAAPAMVLRTTSDPGASVYVSVSAAVAVAPPRTVRCWPSPVSLTCTVLLVPSAVSVTVQVEPPGMP